MLSLTCLYGDVRDYSCTKIRIMAGGQTGHLMVGLAQKLPYPVLLGWDWPHLKTLMRTLLRIQMEISREAKQSLHDLFIPQTKVQWTGVRNTPADLRDGTYLNEAGIVV